MSFRSRLNQQVTVVHPADVSTGWDWGPTATRTVVNGNLQQVHTAEETSGWPADTPDTAVTEWLLFLPAATSVKSVDRIEQGARLFEVVGRANLVWGRRGVHHLEVGLRSVDSDDGGGGGLLPHPGLHPGRGLYPSGG